jgi:hypothetical protein
MSYRDAVASWQMITNERPLPVKVAAARDPCIARSGALT